MPNTSIYFIQESTALGAIKIGRSDNVQSRLKALQTAHSSELKLLLEIPDCMPEMEQLLHARFAESRIRGEWFEATPDLLSVIQKYTNALDLQKYLLGAAPSSPLVLDIETFNFLDDRRCFWTEDKIAEFNRTDTAFHVRKCIDTGDWSWYVAHFNNLINFGFRKGSLGRRLLVWHENDRNDLLRVYRDPASIAFVISRRGTIPDQIMEAEEIVVPSFEVGGCPRIRQSEQVPWFVYRAMIKACKSYQKEVDTNVFNSLKSAADSRDDQIVYGKGRFTRKMFYEAIAKVVQHDLIPAYFLMSPYTYTEIASSTAGIIEGPQVVAALAEGVYGNIAGVPIMVSTRFTNDSVAMSARPEDVGVLAESIAPRMRHEAQPNKLADAFPFSGTIRILIVNDYAISMIHKDPKTDQQKKDAEARKQATLIQQQEEKAGVPPQYRTFG